MTDRAVDPPPSAVTFAVTELLVTPVEPAGHRHSYQSYVCRLEIDGLSEREIRHGNAVRNGVMQALEDERIATRQGTHVVHMLGYYARTGGYQPMDLPGAFAADQLSLTLPLYAGMTDDEQDRVVETMAKVFSPL